jgi:hypothetical protein
MTTKSFGRVLTTSAAVWALSIGFAVSYDMMLPSAAYAQQGGQSGTGGTGSEDKGKGKDQSQGQGKGQGGDRATGQGSSGGGVKGRVFEEQEDDGPSDEAKGPGYKGGRTTTGKPPGAGSKKGDIFGDLWVILRDANGVPILNAAGFVQPLDKDGNLIPLDSEGAPIDESLVVEVELGRSNVARSPEKVLDKSLDAVVSAINAADSVAFDDAGRLVLTTDGVAKTIDSPLENLAIYETLISTGSIPGITDPSKLGDLAYLADGTKTAADLTAATGFLAGSTDKESPLSVDEVVYLNAILGVLGTITGVDGKTYVDFSTVAYDREAVYGDDTVTVLVETSPGVFEVKDVNVYETVFSSTQDTGTGADGFAQAADDARAVLLYVHDNAPR